MPISGISTYADNSYVTNNGTPIVTGTNTTDTDLFLKLLVAQITNQDPFANDQDPTAYVTQLAQFSQLEQIQSLNSNIESMLSINNGLLINSALSTATTMIGKEADFYSTTETGKVETITGRVESVFVEDGSVYFEISVDGKEGLQSVRYDSFLEVRNV